VYKLVEKEAEGLFLTKVNLCLNKEVAVLLPKGETDPVFVCP